MRKSLLKTIVATAVVGTTMALTSVVAMAGTTTYVISDYSSDFASDNSYKNLGNGLEVNFNKYTEETKSLGSENFTGQGKLNAKDYSVIPSIAPTGSTANSNNAIIYEGKKGDTISMAVKGNGIPFAVKVIGDGDATVITNTVTEKSKLEEFTYTLKSDTKICIFALKEGYKQSVMVYRIKVIVPTSNTVELMTSSYAPAGDQYAQDASASYIIHKIASDDLASFDMLALADKTGAAISATESATTTKSVYKTIQFPDGSSITAPEGYYYFAVKVGKTTAPTDVNYSWVNVSAAA